ncbi:MAG TPA: DUF6351 family protein [Mycobacteriales bacterium]|nr:DUF6351 family protein [Mycobacteriales bacterium]
MRGLRRTVRVTCLAAVVTVGTAFLPSQAGAAGGAGQAGAFGRPADHGGGQAHLEITAVSNPRPGLVSGGDVLLRVSQPAGQARVRVTADGRDVSASFAGQPDGSLLGMVTGLRPGHNRIEARLTGHHGSGRPARLDVVDHPVTGPVFSGPQQQPFICQTQAFGLAPATSPLCSAPTQVSFLYRTTAGTFAPLADPDSRPADLAMATVGGRAVPYVVRLEQGTIDRAVYQIAALYDGRSPDPLHPDSAWNRRLVYTFGGGCDAGFHQGTATGGVINDLFLGQGYAVASSTLNVLNNNCNTIISAEAAMMVKEHFVETYGPVVHTIGWGGSGGAIQQYDIADAYPGILDGIIPGVSFPDPLTTIGPVTDCRLMDNFFGAGGNGFTPDQQRQISGFGFYDTCRSWDATFANRVTATDSCDPSIPAALRWDPATNPDGVKCSAAEQMVTQLGRDPRTGFARSPLDNVGVQYGLAALDAGQISPEQFVTLNENIGGYDVVGNLVPQRSQADPRALRAAYADDLVNSGGQGLADTPVIDQRIDLDPAGFGNDIHTTEWSYVMRARMAAHGIAGNQVIIESGFDPATVAAESAFELSAMDRWLDALDADGSPAPLRVKIPRDRPADVGDGCFLPGGQRIVEPLSLTGTGRCPAAFPVHSDTRMVAGAPVDMLPLKCRLTGLDFADYPVTFTADQRARLRAAFPSGVCDFSRPGVGQRRPAGIWLNYGDGSARRPD